MSIVNHNNHHNHLLPPQALTLTLKQPPNSKPPTNLTTIETQTKPTQPNPVQAIPPLTTIETQTKLTQPNLV